MRKAAIFIIMFGLVLVACADPGEQGAIDPTATAWVLESGTLDGEDIPLIETHPITLAFDEEEANGTSACNQYFGGYSISGSEIVFSDLGSTMMACQPDEVMDAEAKYLDALTLVNGFSAAEDRLTLTGEGVELVFVVDETV